MSLLGCLLIFALVLGVSGDTECKGKPGDIYYYAPKQKDIFPAIKVLEYVADANWRTEAGKVRIEALKAALLEDAKNADPTGYKVFSSHPHLFRVKTSSREIITAKDQLGQILLKLLSNGELATSRARRLTSNFLIYLNDKDSEAYNVLKVVPHVED